MSLRANVVAAIVTATAALVLTVILLEDPILEHRQTELARQDMRATLSRVAGALEEGADPDVAADRIGAERALRVTVWGAGGQMQGDTGLDGAGLREATGDWEASDVVEAREEGQGSALIDPSEESEGVEEGLLLAVSQRLEDGRILRGVRPVATISAARKSTRELLLVAGVIACGASLLLGIVLSRTLIRPVEELTRTADALATGDFSTRTRSQRHDELGRLGRAIDHMADQLSERVERMRAEEARLTTMLDGMVEAVFATDAEGRIVLTNRALEGLVTGRARGRTVVSAIRSPELHGAVADALSGRTVSARLQLEMNGEERVLAAHVSPLPERAGVVAVLHDVTDLERADRIRRDFVANASHELRTPLTAIRGYAETLAGGALEDPATAARFVETMLRHTVRLQRLVDDLLALSRAESPDQQFELGPVALRDVVGDAVSSIESHARSRSIEVVIEPMDDLPPVRANAWALDHVLVNLVDNAVKYTPAEGKVTVAGEVEGEQVVLSVADTGPGIPASSRDRIFERFYRVDKGRARDQGGTGLGLAIVKHLVQRMGAEVTVDSAPGRGTTFRVHLEQADDAILPAP